MNLQALMFELMLAGFFAIACFRARANRSEQVQLKDLFRLKNRVDRVMDTKWQWCSMVLLLLIVRRQIGVPIVAELTVISQLVVFLMLPSAPAVQAATVRK
jgi:hypothetical protein